jgi:hypothetical protein
MHPGDESKKSVTINVILPTVVAVIVMSISLGMDIFETNTIWFQRSGSIMTIIGAYIAFHEARLSIQTIKDKDGHVQLLINKELPYAWLSIILLFIGTIIWGYGDLLFSS